MTARRAALLAAGTAGIVCALIVAAFNWRVDVRHSAEYGFSQTFDVDRGIAVPGGYVTANYPDFNRVDIDLRAYSDVPRYDLLVHIRPAHPGAPDIRTIHLGIDGSKVMSRKGAFANPFVTVRFDPIHDSAGRTYYIWVERGPRNQNDVITVWSIKSYSRVSAASVMSAMLHRVDEAWGWGWTSGTLIGAASAVGAGVVLASIGLILLGRSVDRPAARAAGR